MKLCNQPRALAVGSFLSFDGAGMKGNTTQPSKSSEVGPDVNTRRTLIK